MSKDSKKSTIPSLERSDIGNFMFDSSLEGIIIVDRKGTILFVNPSLESMFGYKKNELVQKEATILIPEAYKKECLEYRDNYLKKPKYLVKEIIGLNKNGSTFPAEISINHTSIKGETIIAILVTDLSERRKILDELKEEKENVQRYLDAAGTIIVLINKNQKVEMINKRGCELLGYDEKDILGKNWFKNFLPKKEREVLQSKFNLYIKEQLKEFEKYRNPILSKDGSTPIILWNNVLVKDRKGNIKGTLSSGEDITELVKSKEKLIQLNEKLEIKIKKRTRELGENQQLYKTIARNFPNGVISVLDENLNYVFVEGMEMYKNGITGEILIGTNFLDRVDESLKDSLKNKLTKVLKGDNSNFELILQNKTYIFNAVSLPDKQKKIKQILLVSQDITNLKEAEKNIRLSLKKEKYLNGLKSRFVSIASHEFKTPLTSILNSVTILQRLIERNDSKEKQFKNLDRIKKSVSYLNNILNDFLSFDKLESGKISINETELDFIKFTKEIIDEINLITKIGQKIKLEHHGKTQFVADEQLLRNVYTNLLSNAIKYSPENSSIELSTHADKYQLTIIVQDYGIGIPEEEEEHLFERFFRAKNATHIQGTGLGLNIVKKYLEMIGGEISFKSRINEGTSFTVKIPLHPTITKTAEDENNNLN